MFKIHVSTLPNILEFFYTSLCAKGCLAKRHAVVTCLKSWWKCCQISFDRYVMCAWSEKIGKIIRCNLISVVKFALAHSKLHEITPNFAHILLTSISCLSIFFACREWADVSQFSSELTSECLFDLTTGTATSVNKGNLACGIFCTPRRARTRTEGGSDNTFVGQNSPFFLFFFLSSLLFFY